MQARLFVSGEKFTYSILIWVLYGLLLAAANKGILSNRRFALLAAGTFLLALALLPLIQHLSHS
jgi:hypothetical protein